MNHEQELGNLLARIHRDGGQYIQKHGWQKAIADADALIVGWIHAAAAPVQAVPAEFQNPWRAALENCISGDNYLRASEYRELIEELDALYRLRAAAPAAPQVLAEPASGEFEIRKDGQRVRKDRWEWGIRRIVALLWGNRQQFEIDEVVDAVRELAPAPHADEEALARAVQEGAAPQPAELEALRKDAERYRGLKSLIRPIYRPGHPRIEHYIDGQTIAWSKGEQGYSEAIDSAIDAKVALLNAKVTG